jgi:hypothetical protein
MHLLIPANVQNHIVAFIRLDNFIINVFLLLELLHFG